MLSNISKSKLVKLKWNIIVENSTQEIRNINESKIQMESKQ